MLYDTLDDLTHLNFRTNTVLGRRSLLSERATEKIMYGGANIELNTCKQYITNRRLAGRNI